MEAENETPPRLKRREFIEQNPEGLELVISAGCNTPFGRIVLTMHGGRIVEVEEQRKRRVSDRAAEAA